MSLDITDFWPTFLEEAQHKCDTDGRVDITTVSDDDLKKANEEMVEKIPYYFKGREFGPNDVGARRGVFYMREAMAMWEWILAEIERRANIKNNGVSDDDLFRQEHERWIEQAKKDGIIKDEGEDWP